MKKVYISLLLIGILILGTGIGTFAWFTSTSTSENNIFTTGTLNIEGPGRISSEFNVGNIFPGWVSEQRNISVRNTGTLDFIYRLSIENPVSSILYNGDTPLQVNLNGNGWRDIDTHDNINLGQISASREGQLSIQFRLPEEADNNYKGASADLRFNFDATQIDNVDYQGIVR